MNIKTKEATYSQEWTETALDELAETLTASLWANKGIISEQRVRDILSKAINAAVAAERKKRINSDEAQLIEVRRNDQLREQADKDEQLIKRLDGDIQVERDRADNLEGQLDAAVEALKMMECECEPGITYVCTRCAALAKVKL